MFCLAAASASASTRMAIGWHNQRSSRVGMVVVVGGVVVEEWGYCIGTFTSPHIIQLEMKASYHASTNRHTQALMYG